MILKLVVTTGKFAGKEIPVRNNQFVIGRDSSCTFDPAARRQQAPLRGHRGGRRSLDSRPQKHQRDLR